MRRVFCGGGRDCYGARIRPSPSFTGKYWLEADIPRLTAEEVFPYLAETRGLADILTGVRPALSDPFLFPEMRRCTDRVLAAMRAGERITIFGDYDADGITAAAQLKRFFLRHGIEPRVHLPHREREGYGLKPAAIDACRAEKSTLLITVDTGIASAEAITYASLHGIDVIVTDHHTALHGRPPAYAVIHPYVPAPFPNPHLSGSGVALLVVHALEHALRGDAQGVGWPGVEEDVVLATIGTIADIVPLTGENRTLVQYGLTLLRKLPDGPVRSLLSHAFSEEGVTSTDIAFRVVPQINASGRLEHPDLSLKALTEGGDHIASLFALNEKRKSLTRELADIADGMTDEARAFLCIAHDAFPPGIVGLLAGKLTERYGRPSLVASVKDGVCTASLRSTGDVSLAELLNTDRIRPLLRHFGGHAQAAGCTFVQEHFAALEAALNDEMEARGLRADTLLPRLSISAEIGMDALTPAFARSLQALEPFGSKNDEPHFLLRGVRITDGRTVGADGAHLQCRVGGCKAIGFHMGRFLPHCSTPVDIACTVGMQRWNGSEEPQIRIKDLRMHHSGMESSHTSNEAAYASQHEHPAASPA